MEPAKLLLANSLTITICLQVPRAGIEPARSYAPVDFESTASTNFTTPAFVYDDLRSCDVCCPRDRTFMSE